MITTRWVPRTRRLLIAALALSLLIHLVGGALWAHATHLVARIMQRLPEQHVREEQVATSDVIRLEKRTVPRRAQASRAQPQRQPRPREQVQPRPQSVAVMPKPVVKRPTPQHDTAAPAARPEIAHRTLHAPLHAPRPDTATTRGAGAAAARRTALSAQQLAALNVQFSKTIAASHVDLATIQKQAEEQPVAVKRYPMQFTGAQAQLHKGEGYISPTTVGQRIGNTVWYYTHYTYMWPDGHLEDGDIPWPFRFPVQHDLFALHVKLIPLQLPPRGFHVHGPLQPFLTHFLQVARRAN